MDGNLNALRRRLVVSLCAAMSLIGCASIAPQPRIAGEVAPDASRGCYLGAIYRKAVSSKDRWTGIEGVVVLPRMAFDTARPHPTRPGRLADNASIYLGGWAPVAGDPDGQEIDVGLSWEVVRGPTGAVSREPRAYRPFWRVKQWASAPATPDFYYYPDDVVQMRIEVVAEGEFSFSVSLIERGETARALGAAQAPLAPLTFVTRFPARGYSLTGPQEFKRVNAIDQAGNEGRAVQSTRSQVTGSQWREVWLLRGSERLEMLPARFTDMRCPSPTQVTVAPRASSGERIDLMGNGR